MTPRRREHRARLAAAGLLLGLALLAAPVAGQQVSREVQVPLDPERGVLEVDLRLRTELDLFPEFGGTFRSARLFRVQGGGWVLEIAYRDADGAEARERRPLGEAELAALRSDLQVRLAATGRTRVVGREGRAGLVLGQTVVGLAYHGWALPVALDIDSDRGRVAAYLLTAGASFLVPWLLTQNRTVTVPQRDAFFWGATRGVAYGQLAGLAIGGDRSEDLYEDWSDEERLRLALGSAASVATSLFGYWAAGRFAADAGTVALWSAVGDFGLGAGFGVAYLTGLLDEDVRQVECPDGSGFYCLEEGPDRRAGYAVTLGTALASLALAERWGRVEAYTVGDARALRSFGLLGAQALLPVADALSGGEDDLDGDDKALVAGALAGGVAGLYVGNRVLRSTALSGGDGLLVLAGHVAGGLAALGLTYLLDTGESGDRTLYLTTSAAGSALGSLLTFRAVRGGSAAPAGSGAAPAPERGFANARATLDPAGALLPLLGAAAARPASAPLLLLRF